MGVVNKLDSNTYKVKTADEHDSVYFIKYKKLGIYSVTTRRLHQC